MVATNRSYLGEQTPMAHEKAKLLLESSHSYLERIAAIQSALELGMPYDEIEDYLDWVELMRCEASSGSAE